MVVAVVEEVGDDSFASSTASMATAFTFEGIYIECQTNSKGSTRSFVHNDVFHQTLPVFVKLNQRSQEMAAEPYIRLPELNYFLMNVMKSTRNYLSIHCLSIHTRHTCSI